MALSLELRSRAKLPAHVAKVLAALPEGAHPMTQFSTAVLALQVPARRDILLDAQISVLLFAWGTVQFRVHECAGMLMATAGAVNWLPGVTMRVVHVPCAISVAITAGSC